MASKPSKDEKSKIKSHFYSVSLRTSAKTRKKDNTADTKKKITEIKALAAAQGFEDDVKINSGDETLARLGIFFMNAPEKFAEKVKKLEGIKEVEKPAEGKPVKGRTRRR